MIAAYGFIWGEALHGHDLPSAVAEAQYAYGDMNDGKNISNTSNHDAFGDADEKKSDDDSAATTSNPKDVGYAHSLVQEENPYCSLFRQTAVRALSLPHKATLFEIFCALMDIESGEHIDRATWLAQIERCVFYSLPLEQQQATSLVALDSFKILKRTEMLEAYGEWKNVSGNGETHIVH